MNIIVDTNIILSALIKDSITRKIILNSELRLFYPEMSFHEIKKYEDLVLKKSGLNKRQYFMLLTGLLRKITLIPDENILENINRAKNIMLKVDPDDVVFISAALTLNNSMIWTDDSDFDKQKEIKVLKTKDVIKMTNI